MSPNTTPNAPTTTAARTTSCFPSAQCLAAESSQEKHPPGAASPDIGVQAIKHVTPALAVVERLVGSNAAEPSEL